MGTSDEDRLRECCALGTLAGIAGGIAFWMYFVGKVLDIAQQINVIEINIVAWVLIVCMLGPALGFGGLVGRWLGGQIIYPIRTGNDGIATKRMQSLITRGVVGTLVTLVVAVLWWAILALLAFG